jgi:putative sterol carrier protein
VTYESAQQFFADLGSRPDSSRAANLTASYRFDIEGAGSWRVDVDDGAATVTDTDTDTVTDPGSQDPADCVIATDERTFLGVVNGEQNPMGAFMTGKIRVDGDMGLALRLKDLVG